MLSKKLILPSLATLLFFNGPLIAEESTQENTEISVEGHVAVRSREIDPEKREAMKSLRAEQREDEETTDQSEAQGALQRASNKLISNESQFMLAPSHVVRPQIALTRDRDRFPINSHWLSSVADSNRSLELEDGSHWEVSSSDASIIRTWRREDVLVISPNYSWLSSYDYYITNKSANSYVKANLYVGPVAFGPYSHWIVEVDYVGGHVYLENQMVWCTDPSDDKHLQNWAINDHVIFGLYDSLFSSFDHVLINVNMNNHIRVKQY
jgi:hypothetical protein